MFSRLTCQREGWSACESHHTFMNACPPLTSPHLHSPNPLPPPPEYHISHSYCSFHLYSFTFFDWSVPSLLPLLVLSPSSLTSIQLCLMEPVVRDVSGLHTTPITPPPNPTHPTPARTHTHTHPGGVFTLFNLYTKNWSCVFLTLSYQLISYIRIFCIFELFSCLKLPMRY